ncbi:MAG TPA: NAD(P)/FAD-dependent oxidoreductase [Thermoanaerobaculia bacterium]|jgi:prolycopene isomerase
MAYHKVPNKNEYDVIVIGGGMGGLSAGAGLAYRGANVLVVEQHYRPGGYAHSFRRKDFLFDSAVHLTPGGGKGEGIYSLLEEWGVADKCEFIPIDPMYRTIGPGLETHIRGSKAGFIESHAQYFPEERDGFTKFVDAMDRISSEIRVLSELEVPPSQMMRVMVRYCPTVLRYSSKTLEQMASQFISDPIARSVITTLWTYLGLPPSQCSAVAFSVMMMSFVNENAYYVKGTFQNLAYAFVAGLEKHGGEIILPRRVEKILLDESGRACGVKLDTDARGNGGEEIRARVVISNADAFQTFYKMVGRENLDPEFANSLETRALSVSAFEVFLGVKMDLESMGVIHETFFAPAHDPERVYENHARGDVFGCGISIPSIDDHTVAPAGHHTVCITMFAPFEKDWAMDKQRTAERLIDEAELVIPGLRKNIVYQDAGSPTTMRRYTMNHNGAIYGWDASPKSLATRLAMETPVPSLFLAGHWTRPGGGVFAVITSGQIAAKRAIKELENISLTARKTA